ncbi:glutamyl-tRNA reductase [Arthrobacter cryoconiti]|uniref:Glutamyl-tRNA reductase n=1 Tax=Arthrobacter cryoconiti TaxID=748907 RepID=A0ABV8QYK5_9MICC|nr:glutamyl-tRNA reductase [Arthrobacter cryoconiti]MCC9068338.1 glutamyl-tRNA reductase [Arthrobacter cryoconiti]
MVLFSLVASHSSIDLETVARLSAGAAAVSADVVAGDNAVAGLITLATCNRYELYVQARSAEEVSDARQSIVSAVSFHCGLGEEFVSDALATQHGTHVPRHLFAVSTGLESAVVGEREIAGQVRRALSTAQQAGVSTPALVRLFQSASKTAKEVGARTALGQRGMSIVSVALDLATELADSPSLAGKTAVLFGTGAYAGAAMAQLTQRGCTDIRVYSSSGRAETFTSSRGGMALDESSMPGALAAAHLLLGCSGSEHQLTALDLAQMRQGVSTQLTAIDLALSRDFAPEVADLPNVDLLTLETVRQAAPEEQESTLSEAAALVEDAAKNFEQAQNSRSLDHAIVALRRHTMGVLDDEIAKIRQQHGCTAATAEVEFAMRRMVKQLLHVPTVRAKELAAAGDSESYLAALDALYGLKVEPAARPAATASQRTASDPGTQGSDGQVASA